jgi:CRP-like cAMP-binding protein
MTPFELSSLALFDDVPIPDLVDLINTCPKVEFLRGETVLEEGDPADRALLVVEGSMRVFANTSGGRTMLNTVSAGSLVGEGGLMVQASRRSASLVADSYVRALDIRRKHLVAFEGTEVLAAIQMSMLEATASRLRRTQDQMTTVLQKRRPPRRRAQPKKKQAAPAKSGMWRSFLDALGGLA